MLENYLAEKAAEGFHHLFQVDISPDNFQVEQTRPDKKGDYTLVVFPLARHAKQAPPVIAQKLGSYFVDNVPEIASFEVIQGFLNLAIADSFWMNFIKEHAFDQSFGLTMPKGNPVVIEYSSPNTNKPLHLGHIRNILIGWSVSKILEANGKNVVKVNLVNDRGIHICKSMLAWKRFGENESPENSGLKGDHLAGKYYVLFDKKYKAQISELIQGGLSKEEAEQQAPLMLEAREWLKKWEADDPEIRKLWKTMNGWVYDGFDTTYKRMGISFNKTYYESDTFKLGKAIVEEGLADGVFIRKEDHSVWVNLEEEGLDEKLLLRSDGTSVYMTQDLGTAQLRYADFNPEQLVYVVGNEQNYHFEVLKKILLKLGKEWAEGIHHLNYGMVELPHGKMKSREGTVVDADDLMDEMYKTAGKKTEELGKTHGFSDEERHQLFHKLSMGALKYFILKVDPMKNMLFNPEESIDFSGNTGPFIQYTYARIQSLLKKSGYPLAGLKNITEFTGLTPVKAEIEIIKHLYRFPQVLEQAGNQMNPALIAKYTYELVKEYNSFYQHYSILNNDEEIITRFRIVLSAFTARIIKTTLEFLGIEVPDRM